MRSRLGVCAGLVLVTLALYYPLAQAAFLNYDDPDYITKNPILAHGLEWYTVAWAFTTGTAANWHPLTWLSHLADVDLFALEPGSPHLENVLGHGINAAVLFLALASLTGDFWPSALVAALFAVHPLQVENVAWVSQRKSILSGFFFFASIGVYGAYVRHGGAWRYVFLLLLFAGGLLSKPAVVTLPFVLLLLDYWPLKRLEDTVGGWKACWPFFREKLPLFMLAAASAAVTLWVQARAKAEWSILPLWARLANAVASYGEYLAKLFWPRDLAVIYPHPMQAISGRQVLLSGLLLVAVTAWCYRRRAVRPYLLVGWCWFLGVLVPMIGVVQVGRQAYADRYAYLPAVGIFIALAWFARDLLSRTRYPAGMGAAAASVVLLALASVTHRQARFWLDAETLFRHALAVTQRNPVAHTMLGMALGEKGDPAGAIRELELARQLSPNDPQIHAALATYQLQQGAVAPAVASLERAVELAPTNADYAVRLAAAYQAANRLEDARAMLARAVDAEPGRVDYRIELALLLARLRRLDDATTQFQAALDTDPDSPEAHNGIASVLAQRGRWPEARNHLEAALALRPDFASAQGNLGLLLLRQGKVDEAIAVLRDCVRDHPDFVEGKLNLAAALRKKGEDDAAIATLREAMAQDPKQVAPRLAIVEISIARKDYSGAEREARATIQMFPNSAPAHQLLGGILLLRQDIPGALAEFRRSLELDSNDDVAANNLAWFLATAKDPKLRDPAKAVELAEGLARRSPLPSHLDTLAASYAATGRYTDAADVARQALVRARSAGEARLADDIERRLKQYEQGRSYIQP